MVPRAHPRSAEERSQLCVSCGLCCQGALHDLVPLDEDEEEKAARLRLPLIESSLFRAFRLPCPRLEERKCTVYLERPRTCSTYACRVLLDYGAGEIDLATALGRVEALRGAVASGAPREELAALRTRWFHPD